MAFDAERGTRVGFTGEAIVEQSRLKALKIFPAPASHQPKFGAADRLMEFLVEARKAALHT